MSSPKADTLYWVVDDTGRETAAWFYGSSWRTVDGHWWPVSRVKSRERIASRDELDGMGWEMSSDDA